MSIFLGIDGGGTRSTLLAIDELASPLARLEGGPAIVDPANPASRADTLGELAARALREIGAEEPADALCCALAGARRPAEQAALATALLRQGVARQVFVITDAEAALQDAFGTGPGILAIAGTGSAVWGRGPDGRTRRVGGWGLLLGDEGSGYALGLAALRAAVRASDGRQPPTALTRIVLDYTKVEEEHALVRWTAMADKATIAGLAPFVVEADDEAAHRIRTHEAEELAHQVVTLAHLLHSELPVPLALSGGLVAPGRPFRALVTTALDATGLRYRLRQEVVDAARGAALIGHAHAQRVNAG